MELTFLGTGTSQGVPVIGCNCDVCGSTDARDKRLRTSVHLKVGNSNFVIDSGPDFRTQMLREQVVSLDALLFTHEHMDHIAGFDDIKPFYYLSGQALDIYATRQVQDALKRAFYYIFEADKYPGVPSVNLHTIGDQAFNIQDITFEPLPVIHHRLPVLGFKVGELAYITDASDINAKVIRKVKGSKVLVINALRYEKHLSHFNIAEAIEIIDQVEPENAYLIHMAHDLGKHAEVEASLPNNVFLSYDGLKVHI